MKIQPQMVMAGSLQEFNDIGKYLGLIKLYMQIS